MSKHRLALATFALLCVTTIHQEAEARICGGLLGAQCRKGTFCDFPIGAFCGAADQTGTCRKRPQICTKEYRPVCGCNDKTYANACTAKAAGISVAHDGKCR